MESKRNRLPQPSMLVAIMALCLSVVGTAAALPGKNSVDSGDIKKKAVKASDIAPNAVKSGDIAGGAVTATDLGTIRHEQNPVAGIEESDGDNPERAEVDCEPGEIALAPTLTPNILQDDGDIAITELTFDPNGGAAAGDQGWIIGVSNLDQGDNDNSTVQVTRGALCLSD